MDLDPCSFLMICEDNYLPVSPLLVKVSRVVDIIDTQPQNDARAEVAYTEALKAFTCVVGSFSKWRRVVKDPSRTDLRVYDKTVDKYRSDDFMPLTWSPDGKPNLEECERLNASMSMSTHVNSALIRLGKEMGVVPTHQQCTAYYNSMRHAWQQGVVRGLLFLAATRAGARSGARAGAGAGAGLGPGPGRG